MHAISSVCKAFHPLHFPWVKTKLLTSQLDFPRWKLSVSPSPEILQYFVSTTYCLYPYGLISLIKKKTLGEKIYVLCLFWGGVVFYYCNNIFSPSLCPVKKLMLCLAYSR